MHFARACKQNDKVRLISMTQLLQRCNVILLMVGLVALTGCQGISKGASVAPTAPGQLTPSQASISFGSVNVGSSVTLTGTVTNTGSTSAQISQVATTGAGFSFAGITAPVTVTPNQSVSYSITFAPQSATAFSGALSVSSDASNSALSISLSGTGVANIQTALSVSSPISVGSVIDGTSGTQTGTLTANGANVVVSSVKLGGTNPTEFAISGISFPLTVTTSQPVPFTVTFKPGATGAASASASFASNASNSPAITTLTGSGTAAPVHSVALSWGASSSSTVTSYNVYRAVGASGSCGTYSTLGSTSNSVTSYTDNVVTDGTTYCYAATAVDPSGESTYSNVAQAAIPAP
jgi:hypothetical protein